MVWTIRALDSTNAKKKKDGSQDIKRIKKYSRNPIELFTSKDILSFGAIIYDPFKHQILPRNKYR